MSGTPGEASLSTVWASEFTRPWGRTRAWNVRSALRKRFCGRSSRIAATKSDTASSYSAFGLIQLVLALASFVAFAM
jgi:hypothetical protein